MPEPNAPCCLLIKDIAIDFHRLLGRPAVNGSQLRLIVLQAMCWLCSCRDKILRIGFWLSASCFTSLGITKILHLAGGHLARENEGCWN